MVKIVDPSEGNFDLERIQVKNFIFNRYGIDISGATITQVIREVQAAQKRQDESEIGEIRVFFRDAEKDFNPLWYTAFNYTDTSKSYVNARTSAFKYIEDTPKKLNYLAKAEIWIDGVYKARLY